MSGEQASNVTNVPGVLKAFVIISGIMLLIGAILLVALIMLKAMGDGEESTSEVQRSPIDLELPTGAKIKQMEIDGKRLVEGLSEELPTLDIRRLDTGLFQRAADTAAPRDIYTGSCTFKASGMLRSGTLLGVECTTMDQRGRELSLVADATVPTGLAGQSHDGSSIRHMWQNSFDRAHERCCIQIHHAIPVLDVHLSHGLSRNKPACDMHEDVDPIA